MTVHLAFAQALDACYAGIRAIQAKARTNGFQKRPTWPAIVLCTPKGWTGPNIFVDWIQVEGTFFRAHQVPLAHVRLSPEHLKLLEVWMAATTPRTSSTGTVASFRSWPRSRPKEIRLFEWVRILTPMGGKLTVDCKPPDLQEYSVPVVKPGTELHESTRQLGQLVRCNPSSRSKITFASLPADETNSNRLEMCLPLRTVASSFGNDPHRRRRPSGVRRMAGAMEVLSEHLCQGWLEGVLLRGGTASLPPTRRLRRCPPR